VPEQVALVDAERIEKSFEVGGELVESIRCSVRAFAMAALIGSLLSFLVEVRVAIAALRIGPREKK